MCKILIVFLSYILIHNNASAEVVLSSHLDYESMSRPEVGLVGNTFKILDLTKLTPEIEFVVSYLHHGVIHPITPETRLHFHPAFAYKQPLLKWKTQRDHTYTIMVAPYGRYDYRNPNNIQHLHWLIYNIKDTNDLSKAMVAAKYEIPTPFPWSTEYHRYVFVLMREPPALKLPLKGLPTNYNTYGKFSQQT